MFGKRFKKIQSLFEGATDTRLIPDRKSAFLKLDGEQYLVYYKAMVKKEIHRGDNAIVHGFIVNEIIQNPSNNDGFVICCKN